MRHDELPTREQINAVADKAALEDIRDDLDRAVAQIETQLEFGDGDDEWAHRARSALAFHKYTRGLIERRLMELRQAKKGAAFPADHGRARKRETMSEMSAALMANPRLIIPEGSTIDEIAAFLDLMDLRRKALKADRDDEISFNSPAMRDEEWIRKANEALAQSASERTRIHGLWGALKREAKQSALKVFEERRERAFIDSARAVLPSETYRAIWDRVDRMEAEKSLERQDA